MTRPVPLPDPPPARVKPTLAEFLLARIAEDEATASPFRNPAGVAKRWRCDETGGKVRQVGPTEFGLPDVISESDTHPTAAHIARHDPARVLAECAAKRAIVELHRPEWFRREWPVRRPDVQLCPACAEQPLWPCQMLRLLALPFASHPEYDEAWRPAD